MAASAAVSVAVGAAVSVAVGAAVSMVRHNFFSRYLVIFYGLGPRDMTVINSSKNNNF